MEIFQAALLALLSMCIVALLIYINNNARKIKKLEEENSTLKDTQKKLQISINLKIQSLTTRINDFNIEKSFFEEDQKKFNNERTVFYNNIKESLEHINSISTAYVKSNINKFSQKYNLYPEFEPYRINFSATKIADNVHDITKSTSYKDFRQRKIKYEIDDNGGYNPIIHGYIYAMYNISLPGVIKIGCSDAPSIRSKELTTGKDFRSNAEYAQCKKEFDTYIIGKEFKNDKLRNYVQNLNLKLKTSLPSPFIVAFFFESFIAYEDECLLHFVLKNFNIRRGAGTEFFALTLQETYDVFKNIFPNNAYQYPNFVPHK